MVERSRGSCGPFVRPGLDFLGGEGSGVLAVNGGGIAEDPSVINGLSNTSAFRFLETGSRCDHRESRIERGKVVGIHVSRVLVLGALAKGFQ